ncbi:MAG: hypothetical protein ACTHOJ_15620, partial [Sphingomonas oligoaromativorans]
SFLVESGNPKNAGLSNYFKFLQSEKVFEAITLRSSIDFIEKTSCRAIQLADVVAFFSRRLLNLRKDGEYCLNNVPRVPPLQVMIDRVPIRFEHNWFGGSAMPTDFAEFSRQIQTRALVVTSKYGGTG